jgi:hypothetical protein
MIPLGLAQQVTNNQKPKLGPPKPTKPKVSNNLATVMAAVDMHLGTKQGDPRREAIKAYILSKDPTGNDAERLSHEALAANTFMDVVNPPKPQTRPMGTPSPLTDEEVAKRADVARRRQIQTNPKSTPAEVIGSYRPRNNPTKTQANQRNNPDTPEYKMREYDESQGFGVTSGVRPPGVSDDAWQARMRQREVATGSGRWVEDPEQAMMSAAAFNPRTGMNSPTKGSEANIAVGRNIERLGKENSPGAALGKVVGGVTKYSGQVFSDTYFNGLRPAIYDAEIKGGRTPKQAKELLDTFDDYAGQFAQVLASIVTGGASAAAAGTRFANALKGMNQAAQVQLAPMVLQLSDPRTTPEERSAMIQQMAKEPSTWLMVIGHGLPKAIRAVAHVDTSAIKGLDMRRSAIVMKGVQDMQSGIPVEPAAKAHIKTAAEKLGNPDPDAVFQTQTELVQKGASPEDALNAAKVIHSVAEPVATKSNPFTAEDAFPETAPKPKAEPKPKAAPVKAPEKPVESVQPAKAVEVPKTPEDSPVAIVRESHAPDTKRWSPEIEAEYRTGKRKNGMTAKQREFLGEKLKSLWERANGDNNPFVDGHTESIEIPGDGTFTVRDWMQIASLHKAVIGESVEPGHYNADRAKGLSPNPNPGRSSRADSPGRPTEPLPAARRTVEMVGGDVGKAYRSTKTVMDNWDGPLPEGSEQTLSAIIDIGLSKNKEYTGLRSAAEKAKQRMDSTFNTYERRGTKRWQEAFNQYNEDRAHYEQPYKDYAAKADKIKNAYTKELDANVATKPKRTAKTKAELDQAIQDFKTKPGSNVIGAGGFDPVKLVHAAKVIEKGVAHGLATLEEIVQHYTEAIGRKLTKDEDSMLKHEWAKHTIKDARDTVESFKQEVAPKTPEKAQNASSTLYHGSPTNTFDAPDPTRPFFLSTSDAEANRYAIGKGGNRVRSDATTVIRHDSGQTYRWDSERKFAIRDKSADIPGEVDYSFDLPDKIPASEISKDSWGEYITGGSTRKATLSVPESRILNAETDGGLKVLAGFSHKGNTFAKAIIDSAKEGVMHWDMTKESFYQDAWKNIIGPQLKDAGFDGVKFQEGFGGLGSDTPYTYMVLDPSVVKMEGSKPSEPATPIKPPKPPQNASEGLETPNKTGLARQFTDPERVARDLAETKAPAQTVEKLVNAVKKDYSHTKADSALTRSMKEDYRPTREQIVNDTAMVATLKREVKNEYDKLLRKDSLTGQDEADIRAITDKLDQIDEYAQKVRTHWHDLGMALQIAYKPDFTVADLTMKARSIYGGDLPPAMVEKFKEIVTKYDALQAELDAIKSKGVPREVSAIKLSKPEASRRSALNSLKRLGLEVVGADNIPGAGRGVSKSKQSGAVHIPTPGPNAENQIRMAVRKIAKSYILDGHPDANSLDGVVGLVKSHLPGMSDHDILRYMSDQYHRTLLQSDLQMREATNHMRQIQEAARRREWSTWQSGAANMGEFLNTTQRGIRASMDVSAPFRQGRRFMFTKEWVNAWMPSTKAMFSKDHARAADLHSAELARSPYYLKAVESKLGLTQGGSSFSKAEEMWAGRLLHDWAQGKGAASLGGKVNPLRAYANLIGKSEAHYTTFLNDLRMRLFENLAKKAPNDKAYLDGIAQMINTMTGRGHGQVAERVLSNPAAGNIMFAPRYAWSEIQSTAGVPLWNTSSRLAQKEVAKAYGRNLAVTVTALSLAKLFGHEVVTDPRDTDFLKMKLKNGRTLDILGASQQYLRLAARMAYGTVSKKGNFSAPGDYGSDPFWQAVANKLSPAAQLLMGLLSGWKAPDDGGKWVEKPVWKVVRDMVVPIGASKINDDPESKNPLVWAANLAGVDYDKTQPHENSVPPIQGLPQGMRQLIGQPSITTKKGGATTKPAKAKVEYAGRTR